MKAQKKTRWWMNTCFLSVSKYELMFGTSKIVIQIGIWGDYLILSCVRTIQFC